ncbi:MAG: VanZ family protein [Bacteroidetes bacterium]|nr:VanZ family protein [Bacteroidota bacterium]
MSSFRQNRKWIFAFSALYLSALSYLLFFAFFRTGTTTRVNLVPFDSIVSLTVYTFKTGEDWWHWFVNVPGNLLAFMPMAIPLHFYLKGKLHRAWFFLLTVVIPCFAEMLQFVFQTGSCDVDDVILNVAGIWLGIAVLNPFRRQH